MSGEASLEIVRLGAADYPRIMLLWEAAGLHIKPAGRDAQDAFAQQMALGVQQAIGAQAPNGTLVGVTLTTHDTRKGWINRLAVHPDYQRQGVGRRLIRAAEDQLKAQGITVIAALIEPDNVASLTLFVSAGYLEWPGMHYVSKRQSPDA
ncbi:MAG: GNAT family N-acetyltransferase [Anaerolineae bacterium]|nr:GNAT family N-acetyltransferase [Anaerolineae bacterium]